MARYLDSIGLYIEEFNAVYSKEKLEDAQKYAKDLKDRFTVLWLYSDLMI